MKLVLANKVFTVVRGRMEKLVETIEELLVQIENKDESRDGWSCSLEENGSEGESQYNDDVIDASDAGDDSEEQERVIEWAKRAEIAAEVAVRETLFAKQEAERLRLISNAKLTIWGWAYFCLWSSNQCQWWFSCRVVRGKVDLEYSCLYLFLSHRKCSPRWKPCYKI